MTFCPDIHAPPQDNCNYFGNPVISVNSLDYSQLFVRNHVGYKKAF